MNNQILGFIGGSGLYDIDFIRVRKGIPKIVKQLKGIYADQLRSMFEKYTGLYTSL